jgi:hypothetical protein
MQEISMSHRHNSPEMSFALERLGVERVRHKQTSEFQIKVGPYNYYPGKGTIFIDGDREARPERGLESFITLLRKLQNRNPRLFENKNASHSAKHTVPGFDIRDAIVDSRSA